jgi:hypothetical protein
MKRFCIESDKLYNLSENDEDSIHSLTATPTQNPSWQTPSLGRTPPGVLDRMLQAVWKGRMQMRRGARARPQVLSVGQLSQQPSRNGLCAPRLPGTSGSIPGQFPEGPRHSRRDLCRQSRTVASQGKTLEDQCAYRNHADLDGTRRHRLGRGYCGQHAPRTPPGDVFQSGDDGGTQ